MKSKENTFFQGELRNFNGEEESKILDELLFFIKEKGLTVSQAENLLINATKMLGQYSTLLTIEDYEKITGKNVFVNPES